MILIVEDDTVMSGLLHQVIQDSATGTVTVFAETMKRAQEVLDKIQPDLIFLDLGLSDSQGMETFTRVRNKNTTSPIVVITGDESLETKQEILKLGATEYINKNTISSNKITTAIERAMKRKQGYEKVRRGAEKLTNAFAYAGRMK